MTSKLSIPFFYRRCYVFLIAFVSLSISCYQDVIDLDLSDFESEVVIEGNITDQPGPYTVTISKTVSYENSTNFPLVSGAEIVIADDAGNVETLREVRAGTYQTSSLQGVPGKTYTLFVNVEGKEYTASCSMPEPLELDSVTYDLYDQFAYLRCEFADREGMDEFFRLNIYRNEICVCSTPVRITACPLLQSAYSTTVYRP